MQRIIFSDIVKAKWQCFQTVEETNNQLKQAGFSKVELIYDSARMFSTVIARRI